MRSEHENTTAMYSEHDSFFYTSARKSGDSRKEHDDTGHSPLASKYFGLNRAGDGGIEEEGGGDKLLCK